MSNNTKQHDKDMRKFQKEYEKTKADVWKKTRHFELRSHKRAVLGVLVFIVLLGMFLAAEVSSGYVEKVSRRWKAGRNYEKTCSQMETYLDEGAYGDLFAVWGILPSDGQRIRKVCILVSHSVVCLAL